jgi:hypothetical protein
LYSWKKVKTLLGYYPNTSQFKLAQLIVNYWLQILGIWGTSSSRWAPWLLEHGCHGAYCRWPLEFASSMELRRGARLPVNRLRPRRRQRICVCDARLRRWKVTRPDCSGSEGGDKPTFGILDLWMDR